MLWSVGCPTMVVAAMKDDTLKKLKSMKLVFSEAYQRQNYRELEYQPMSFYERLMRNMISVTITISNGWSRTRNSPSYPLSVEILIISQTVIWTGTFLKVWWTMIIYGKGWWWGRNYYQRCNCSYWCSGRRYGLYSAFCCNSCDWGRFFTVDLQLR